ncbi:MAG: NAD(P)-dependent alcohol dehydrogenase [Candidatus Aegiribacteria sp.]|nr:NAD(P)-dependent alcohol dehydrogenase [Candidatus Aegiribacteria sp.]
MKAIVFEKYGPPDVLEMIKMARPEPEDDEVLIRIHAVSLNGSDRELLSGKPLYARIGGLLKPGQTIPGSDIAGQVESVGESHKEFKPGDEVFGEMPGYNGGLAEYVTTHGKTLTLKPAGLTFEQAAAIPQAGSIALRGILDKGKAKPGQKVLINGAGGSAGSYAIQLAKLCGAEVTGVDNTGKLDFMRSLGADKVIDYSREEFTNSGEKYDLILDLIARHSVIACRKTLRPNGTYFFVGGSMTVMFQILLMGPLIRWTTNRNLRILMVPQNRKDLISITEFCEAGDIVPAIDRVYPLSDFQEAFQHFAEGNAKGKVVITLGHGGIT